MTMPQWNLEAKAEGINYIVLVYGKAEGFAFCPQDLKLPFRVGGDYNGNWPVTSEAALEYYEKYFNTCSEESVGWFIPFVWKVFAGEDFSLRDLEIEERGLRVIKGRWPW